MSPFGGNPSLLWVSPPIQRMGLLIRGPHDTRNAYVKPAFLDTSGSALEPGAAARLRLVARHCQGPGDGKALGNEGLPDVAGLSGDQMAPQTDLLEANGVSVQHVRAPGDMGAQRSRPGCINTAQHQKNAEAAVARSVAQKNKVYAERVAGANQLQPFCPHRHDVYISLTTSGDTRSVDVLTQMSQQQRNMGDEPDILS